MISLEWQKLESSNFATIIFGIGEAGHFKFHLLIDTEEYSCICDILPLKGMCSELLDFKKYFEK